MSTDEYVPSDEEMLSAYVTGRMMRDGLMRTEAEQEFRCGLARVRRDAKVEALREAVEKHAITIPDALGYKVPAVTVEDLMDAADEYETGGQA